MLGSYAYLPMGVRIAHAGPPKNANSTKRNNPAITPAQRISWIMRLIMLMVFPVAVVF